MHWLLGYWLAGLLVGVGISIYAVVDSYFNGVDVTLQDLGELVLVTICSLVFWPGIVVVSAIQWVVKKWKLNRNTVILPGNRSVKTYRALRDGDPT